MNKKLIIALLVSSFTSSAAMAEDDDLLTGDARLACEAVLCLSTNAGRPSECNKSIAKYFSITDKKPSKIPKKRKNFLKLCPQSNESDDMLSLVDNIVNAADRCDANALNKNKKVEKIEVCETSYEREENGYLVYQNSNKTGNKKPVEIKDCHYESKIVINDSLPNYCASYFNHENTYITPPKFVDGRWIN